MDITASLLHPRILVVEDEPLLRMFNADMLSEAGFDVIEACDADEALHLLETSASRRSGPTSASS